MGSGNQGVILVPRRPPGASRPSPKTRKRCSGKEGYGTSEAGAGLLHLKTQVRWLGLNECGAHCARKPQAEAVGGQPATGQAYLARAAGKKRLNAAVRARGVEPPSQATTQRKPRLRLALDHAQFQPLHQTSNKRWGGRPRTVLASMRSSLRISRGEEALRFGLFRAESSMELSAADGAVAARGLEGEREADLPATAKSDSSVSRCLGASTSFQAPR